MPEVETPELRHGRYLRYAAEARELAARTTGFVRAHHLHVAIAWEAKARRLPPEVLQPKPHLALVSERALELSSTERYTHALGHSTEAVRSRLLTEALTRSPLA